MSDYKIYSTEKNYIGQRCFISQNGIPVQGIIIDTATRDGQLGFLVQVPGKETLVFIPENKILD